MIADIVIKYRWGFIAFWIILTAALVHWVPAVEPGTSEARSYLPASAPYSQAIEVTERCFPKMAAQSEAVVVVERQKQPLTSEDLVAVETLASSIRTRLPQYIVRSPSSIGLPQGSNPLVSPADKNGQAALIMVNVQANFITIAASHAVDRVRDEVKAAALPAGLKGHITGSAAFGHDYGEASNTSSHRQSINNPPSASTSIIIINLGTHHPLT